MDFNETANKNASIHSKFSDQNRALVLAWLIPSLQWNTTAVSRPQHSSYTFHGCTTVLEWKIIEVSGVTSYVHISF